LSLIQYHTVGKEVGLHASSTSVLYGGELLHWQSGRFKLGDKEVEAIWQRAGWVLNLGKRENLLLWRNTQSQC